MNSVRSTTQLSSVLQRSDTWRGSRYRTARSALATGYPGLDLLLQGGWPDCGVIEIVSHQQGELSLLLSLLRQLHRQQRAGAAVCLIDSPHPPNSEALRQRGIDPQGWLLVHSRSLREWLWSAEQSLRHGAISFAWLAHRQRPNSAELRKLQLVANDRQLPLAVITRGGRPLDHTVLRLELQPPTAALTTQAAQLLVAKQRGANPGASGLIELAEC